MNSSHNASMLEALLANIQAQEVKFIDLRFTGLDGVVRTITYGADYLTQDHYFNGVNLDGMVLVPDMATAFLDPFAVEKTLVIICNAANPAVPDPRAIASRAMEYAAGEDIKFVLNVGFHVFDDVRFNSGSKNSFVKIDSYEFMDNSAKKYETSNGAHRSADSHKQTQPIDTLHDIRSEIFSVLVSMGMQPMYHYHGAAAAQCNIAYADDDLLMAADGLQLLKYVTKNIITSYGKTATFMPKPIVDAIGAGLSVEQEVAAEKFRHYLGGITKHIKAINAFSNPTHGSYQRLVLEPGLGEQSMEVKEVIRSDFPDPSANPYLMLSAIVMAGMDGIKHKMEPSCILPHAASLEEALSALDKDRAFLCMGKVFSDAAIDQYIDMQKTKIDKYRRAANVVDFELDYGC